MPRNTCDPTVTPVNPADEDCDCPKCSAAMEPIEICVEGLPLQHVQLCPRCYLVTWRDAHGFQSRQGVPMKKGFNPGLEPSRLTGEPEEC